MTNKVYDLITERILTQLDNGVVPWRKPWGVQPGLMPMNGTNSREYKGINALMLGLSGYTDVRWMTYKQATERGGQVRKGEKSTPIIFWKQSQVQDTNDAGETVTKTIPMLHLNHPRNWPSSNFAINLQPRQCRQTGQMSGEGWPTSTGFRPGASHDNESPK